MKPFTHLLAAIVVSGAVNSCLGPFNPDNPGMGKLSDNDSNTPATTINTATLVAYWKCDDSGKVLKNKASDSLRNRGDMYGIKLDSGFDKSSKSIKFEDDNSKVVVLDDSTLNFGTRDFTISFWCKPTKRNSDDIATIISKGLKDSTGTFTLTITANKFTVILNNNKYQSTNANDTLIDNKWNHIALIRKEHILTLYTNGNNYSPGSATVHSLNNSERLIIGMNANGDYKYRGLLDEIKIELKAWDQMDIDAEYSKRTID